MRFLATFISRLFDPIVVLCVLTMLAALSSGLSFSSLTWFFLVFFGGMVLPPALLLVWAVMTKRVSGWDVSNRRQRVHVLIILLGFLLIDFVLVFSFQNVFLTRLFVMFLLWFLGFFFMTLFWKISGHVGIMTLAVGLILQWFGPSLWPIVLLIPMVGWARVLEKRHTLGQAVGGFFYSLAILIIHYY